MDSGLTRPRWCRAATLLSTVAIAISACSGGGGGGTTAEKAPSSQQILRINPGVEPNNWDPGQQSYTYEANVGREAFSPLLRDKTDGSDVEPLTADSYNVSSDGLTYTFHIRSSAKWSDGKPVTAQDFVYGWQRLLDPALAASYVDPFFDQTVAGAQNYANVSTSDEGAVTSFINGLGLSAPDSSHFVVKLQSPAPYFKWVATLWVGAPIRKDLVESAAGGPVKWTDATGLEKWVQNVTSIVGNGPFKITEEVPKDHVLLTPNTYAWNPPTIQKLYLYFISDANTSFSKYQTSELDQISVPLADVKVVSGANYKNQLIKTQTGPWWMAFNMKNVPVLAKKSVRLALSKSVDRNKLCADVQQGTCKPNQTLLPDYFTQNDKSAGKAQDYDPSAAKQMLTPDDVTALNGLHLLTRNTQANITINTFISEQWKTNLGVNIPVQVLDSKTVTSRIRKGQFDIYGPDGWGFDYPDTQDISGLFTTGNCHNLNWGCYSNPDYDNLVKQSNQELNSSKRTSELHQIEKTLADDAAVMFMYESTEWDLAKPYVQLDKAPGLDDEYTPGDLHYDKAYITKH